MNSSPSTEPLKVHYHVYVKLPQLLVLIQLHLHHILIPYCYEANVYFVVYTHVAQISVFTWMQDEVFSFTLVLKYVRSYKFAYKESNWTVPDQTALIWTMRGQTQVCITKLSSEICALLSYHTAGSSNSLLIFWHNLSVPSSRVKKSKWENSAWLKLTDTSFFGT